MAAEVDAQESEKVNGAHTEDTKEENDSIEKTPDMKDETLLSTLTKEETESSIDIVETDSPLKKTRGQLDAMTATSSTTSDVDNESGEPKNGKVFLKRLNSWRMNSRQVLSSKANEVLVAATPVAARAGQAVRHAANQAGQAATQAATQAAATRAANARATAKDENPTNDEEENDSHPHSDSDNEKVEGKEVDDKEEDETSGEEDTNGKEETSSKTTEVSDTAEKEATISTSPTSSTSSATNSFRGRYNTDADTKQRPTTEIIGAKILNTFNNLKDTPRKSSNQQMQTDSNVGPHMKSLLTTLKEGEQLLLLGRGLMGVNLKSCFKGGVYVDYIVPGGNADKSGIVTVGDVLVKVGDIDVRKKGIHDVPDIIAKANRPAIIVLSRIHLYPSPHGTPMDTVVSVLHSVQEQVRLSEEAKLSTMPLSSNDVNDATAATVVNSEGSQPDSIVHSSAIAPPSPDLTANATNDHSELSCYSALSRACQGDPMFSSVLRKVFTERCSDSRSLPFVTTHISSDDLIAEDGDSEQKPSESIKLMMWLEIQCYCELWGITPVQRRRDHAISITHKFLLPGPPPMSTNENGYPDNGTSPMFGVRSAMPEDIISNIEANIRDPEKPVPRNLFQELQDHLENSLCGACFASFFLSAESAKMRAFLRNTAPFLSIPFDQLFEALVQGDINAIKYFHYITLYLLSDDGRRGEGISASLFIRRYLDQNIEAASAVLLRDDGGTSDQTGQSKNDDAETKSQVCKSLINAYEHLWENFLAPGGGVLDQHGHSNECQDVLKEARELLLSAVGHSSSNCEGNSGAIPVVKTEEDICRALISNEVRLALRRLTDELLFEYAANLNPKFRMSDIHELLCEEINQYSMTNFICAVGNDGKDKEFTAPGLQKGCISRLLRQSELSNNISSHRPLKTAWGSVECVPNQKQGSEVEDENGVSEEKKSSSPDTQASSVETNQAYNAEFAVIFGTKEALDDVAQPLGPKTDHSWLRRFAAVQLNASDDGSDKGPSDGRPGFKRSTSILDTDTRIPSTFESYATVPPLRERPLGCAPMVSNNGWEVSLVSFTVPHSASDQPNACVYGVSLVLRQKNAINDKETEQVSCKSELIRGANNEEFVQKLKQESWSKKHRENGNTVGIALVSRLNVIPAMRSTLSKFYNDFSKNGEGSQLIGGLADFLGIFSSSDVDTDILSCTLAPFLNAGSSPWISQPTDHQAKVFEQDSGEHLLRSLPPTPLALVFITALLEQKIVFSSSRRSILLSAATAINKLLDPLAWPHLLVPLVPSTLAGDLVHYPAPFIIGIPAEDQGSVQILNSLPDDVTLVDLDVGRVILAADYGAEKLGGDLRLQVLYLAEEMGSLLGTELASKSWCCDDPSQTIGNGSTADPRIDSFPIAQRVCSDFITELLAGTNSCCTWVEESCEEQSEARLTQHQAGECIVLFDENRFYHLKNLRAKGKYMPLLQVNSSHNNGGRVTLRTATNLALGLDDFDLVLETFLRSQAMSTFISSRSKSTMVYW